MGVSHFRVDWLPHRKDQTEDNISKEQRKVVDWDLHAEFVLMALIFHTGSEYDKIKWKF